jgi:hypothetical protein
MKTLVKTGKVMKIDPYELLNLYRYARYHIRWEPEGFIEKLKEIYQYRDQKKYLRRIKFHDENNISKGVVVNIPVNIVILPSFIHNKVTRSYKGLIRLRNLDKASVSIDNISYFDVYKVVNSPTKGKFDEINLSISIIPDRVDGNYALDYLWIDVRESYLSRAFMQPLIEAVILLHYEGDVTIKRNIDYVKQIEGTSYSRLSQDTMYSISHIEENLTLTLNLFHTLYSYNFEEDDVVGWLFKQYSDTVRSFGCEFEEAILTASKVISAFLF